MQRFLCSIVVGLLYIHIIQAQVIDRDLCPNGIINTIAPNWRTVPPRFEVVGELATNDGIAEVSQAFSTQRDTIFFTAKSGDVRFYWNFVTNEQFQVLNTVINQQVVPQCFREVITPTTQTSVIQPNTLIVKPSILLGYDPRNQLNSFWGVQYDADDSLRGIPTNRFKSCFYVNDIRATVAATYQVSDVTKFQSYLPPNISVILQIDVKIKNENGRQDSYTYNVFRYMPNPSRREERQALDTQAGVFCENRTNTLSLPTDIPERLSSNSEAIVPQFNASIFSTHGLFDGEFELTRFDVWFPDPTGGPQVQHYTEIHDYAVGLTYQYNYTNRQCAVRNITTTFNDGVFVDDQPNLIQMGSPQHLFLLDDVNYHYTGEKQCRDRIWCHVWIGTVSMPNDTIQYREWYWASRINDQPLTQWIPLKLVIRLQIKGIPISTFETSIFNFRRQPFTIFEIDYTLADCYRALGPSENFNLGVLTFKLANEKNYPVFDNLNYLRLRVFEGLIFGLRIRPTRISNLLVDKHNSDIIVTFTLLDVPPRTGPVENPLKERTFDKIVDSFTSIIDSDGFAVRARAGTKQVTLRAIPQSLNVVSRSKEINWKSSGPRITGLWIGLIIAGIAIGVVGGYFVYGKLANS